MMQRPRRSSRTRITRRFVRQVVDTIRDGFRPEKVVVFGSVARGAPRRGSDLDVLVVMRPRGPVYRRAAQIRMALPRSIPIDVLVFSPAEVKRWNGAPGHIVTEAFRTGKVMYEKGS